MYGIGYHRYFGNFLRNCLEILWIFWEFIKNFLRIFLGDGLFGKTFLEKNFWEDFLGGIFLGGLFLGGIFWEEFFVYIIKVS